MSLKKKNFKKDIIAKILKIAKNEIKRLKKKNTKNRNVDLT